MCITSTSDNCEASATVRSAPQFAASFVPASKLMSASLSHNSLPPSVRTEDRQRNSSKSSSLSPTDKHPHSSTSCLRRVHINVNDLYEETSSEDDLLPGPPVSGPGMNFQQSSMLSTSSALSHSATMSTSVAACTSAVSSGQEKVTDHNPKISSFFQRQVILMQIKAFRLICELKKIMHSTCTSGSPVVLLILRLKKLVEGLPCSRTKN